MTWREVLKLVKEDIKKAIVKANDEGNYLRVQYLKNCREQLKQKLRDFKNAN